MNYKYNPNDVVWHKADEIPNSNRLFLYRCDVKTFDLAYGVESNRWENFCKTNNLKDWVYITDILPSWILNELDKFYVSIKSNQ